MSRTILKVLIGVIAAFFVFWGFGFLPAKADSHLLINEIYYDPLGSEPNEEWIELYNPGVVAIDLSNHKIGDEEIQGGGEGMYSFPTGSSINPDAFLVVANRAVSFYALYGKNPDFELIESDSLVPNLIKYTTWANGSVNLSNTGDEVLLLDGTDSVIDAVVYGGGSYDSIIAYPGVVKSGHSIERLSKGGDTDNCATDFVNQATPTPGSEYVPPIFTDPNDGVTLEDQDDSEIKLSSIADARNMNDGEKVRVEGVVTVEPGKLSTQYFYIEDATGGIQIYSYKKDFPAIQPEIGYR